MEMITFDDLLSIQSKELIIMWLASDKNFSISLGMIHIMQNQAINSALAWNDLIHDVLKQIDTKYSQSIRVRVFISITSLMNRSSNLPLNIFSWIHQVHCSINVVLRMILTVRGTQTVMCFVFAHKQWKWQWYSLNAHARCEDTKRDT